MIIDILIGVNFCYNQGMKKIKAFGYVFYRSLTNFSYYKDVIKTNFSFSVKYFLFLMLVASVIASVKISVTVVPDMIKGLQKVVTDAKSFYPNDLVFTIKDGEWNVNMPEPLVVPFPIVQDSPESTGTPKNLIVFWKNGTIDDLKKLDTLALVNKVNVLYKDGERITGYPIKNLPDSRFDRNDFAKAVKSFDTILSVLPVLFVLGALVFTFLGNTIFRIIYFSWFGLLTWLVAKTMGTDLGYKNSLKIAIHASTLPVLISLVVGLLGFTLPIPLWFALTNLLVATLVISNLKKADKSQEIKK